MKKLLKIKVMKLKNNDDGKYYKLLFLNYFDGNYGIDAKPNVSNTFEMGVCKLDFNDKKNELTVYLRRPGLLIGKGGKIINELSDHLGCKIKIVEVILYK